MLVPTELACPDLAELLESSLVLDVAQPVVLIAPLPDQRRLKCSAPLDDFVDLRLH